MSQFDKLGAVFVGVFGEGAEYTIQTAGGAKTVKGIFREQDQILLPGDEFEGIVSAVPTLRINRADAAGIEDGNQVTINTVAFEVRALIDDGRAMAVLRLETV